MDHPQIALLREQLSQGSVTIDEITRLANESLVNNDLEKAYSLISILAEQPDVSGHLLSTAAAVALARGEREHAYGLFEKVLDQSPDDFDAGYNLALLDLQNGALAEAQSRLKELLKKNPKNAALYNDLAVLHINKDEVSGALDCWRQALLIDPNLSLARDNAMEILVEKKMVDEGKRLLLLNARASGVTHKSIREIRGWARNLEKIADEQDAVVLEPGKRTEMRAISGKKIAVFAGIDTFAVDIVRHLALANEIKTFNGGSRERMRQLLEWADIAWFEWCDQLLIEATTMPKTCKMVCRLHSYEAFSDMPGRVDWTKVDLLIFVNGSVKDVLDKHFKITTPYKVIHNAVDTTLYTIPRSKVYGKKIASVGYINYKKNPELLLYCFKKIHQYDPQYTLHLAGAHQDPRIQLYFEHFLKENPLPVYFDGWIDDMPAWYADKDFVISTSLFESFHYSIAEGMAAGLMPLIHNWYGAKGLYPREYLYNDPDECLELLKRLEKDDRAGLAEKNRQFIIDNYGLEDKLATISNELAQLIEQQTAQLQPH
ncbi:MAG: glycosyltransferase [Candidatus Zixiibacteriota bacterium]